MDKFKAMPRKMRGGLIASAITLLVALLALGAGTAFGAEGGLAGLLKKAVGDAAGSVVNAASGGMLMAEGSGTPMRANVMLLLEDDSDPIHVPESVTLKIIRREGFEDAEVESVKTFSSSDDNVNVIESNNGKKYLQIIDAWTEADNVDTPSSGFEKRFVAEAEGWQFGTGSGSTFSTTSNCYVGTNPSVTGINGSLRYYPVSAYQQYTVSAVWEDGDNGASMPRDNNYVAGYTNRFKFEYASGQGEVSGSGYLEPGQSWTTTVEIPADWEGDSLSYDFRTRFSFNQISATNRYEVVNTVVDDTNKTVQFHLRLANDTDSVTIPVRITWDDDDDSRGFRPSTLKVGVYTNQNTLSGGAPNLNNPLGEYVFTADESWEHTFTSISRDVYGTTYDYNNRLPRTDENGDPVEYTFVQNDMTYPPSDDTKKFQAYYLSSAGDQPIVTFDGTNDVVLPYRLASMQSDVSVTWDDNGNSAGSRPSSVTVNIPFTIGKDRYTNVYNPGPETTKTVQIVLTSADEDPLNPNVWKRSCDYKVITDEGYYCNPTEPITVDGMAGYTSTVTTRQHKGYPIAGIDIVGTRGASTVDIPVTKTWDDNDNELNNRPSSVTYHLYAATNVDGNDTCPTEPTLVGTQTATAADSYATTFEGMPLTDGGGNAITYVVGEDTVVGYEPVEGYLKIGDSYQLRHSCVFDGTNPVAITNATAHGYGFTVMKIWDDMDDTSGRPQSATFHLWADGTEVDTLTLTQENVYFQTYSQWKTGRNTFKDAYPDLYAGCLVDLPEEADLWSGVFTNGSSYYPVARNGVAISYEITEDSNPSYESVNGGIYRTFFNKDYVRFVEFVNTRIPTVDIPVTKAWDDNNDQFGNRPASVTYKLYSVPTSNTSGFSYGYPQCTVEPTLVATQTASSANGYATTFEDKPARDGSGNELTYIVGEDPVPGYKAVPGYNGVAGESTWFITQSCAFDGTNPITITNNLLPGYNFGIRKVWDDQGHEAERPSVTFGLYEQGGTEPLAEMTLTSANAMENSTTAENYANIRALMPSLPEDMTKVWSGTFPLAQTIAAATAEKPYVPQYKNGQPAVYEVRETAITGYTSSVGAWEVANTFKPFNQASIVTNTYIPKGNLTVSKTVTGDGASQSQSFPFTITVDGAGNGTYGDLTFTNGVATTSLAHNQTVTATGLPAGATYSVSEGTVENYTPSWTNQSGAIVADQTTAVSCTNTYAAPPTLLQPETVEITMNRDDDDPSGDPITLTLVETLPEEITPDEVDTSNLNLVVVPPAPSEPRSYPPTKDPGTNSLVYNFSMDDDDEMTVPIVEGSDVTIANTSPNEDITQDSNSPTTQSGQVLVLRSIMRGTPIPPITVGATPKAAPAHPQRTQGWIRVNTNTNVNDAVSYEAFKVFDAAVSYDGTDYKGTHIEWESDAVKTAVMGFLRNAENGSEYTSWLATKYGKDTSSVTAGDQELAQNAAEWIAKKIGESAEDTTANTTPKTTKGDTFASKLATVLRNYNLASIPVPANTVTPVDQGYYVVATATSTIDNGEAGTAPIWAPVPQTGYTVEEKVSIPRFNKQVKDNTDDIVNFNKVADASTGQALDFRLTTTLPANVKAFPSYPLTIVDDLPDGMDPLELNQANGYSVYLGEADITSQVVATSTQGGTLTFSIANALALDGVDGNSVITVNYRAALNENATKGSDGNMNTATLTYPADPMTSETGELTSSAKVLTYQLRVDKVDEANRLNVDGAQFAAQTTVGGTTYWVKSDGSLTTTQAERGVWTTTNGTLTIPGVDEGTYAIKEIQAPQNYETIASDLEVVIDATKDYAGGTLTSLTATASGANGTLVSNPSPTQDGVVGTDTATGIVRVRISDVKQIVLPLTGMPVKTLGIIVGTGIAIASVVAFLVKRHKEKDEEESE